MTKSLKIIPDLCTGCMQCELACSWVQTGAFQPARSLIRVNVFDEEASYAPYTCLQCDEAWCLNACPVNAIGIDETTGAKLILETLCIGHFECHETIKDVGLAHLSTLKHHAHIVAASGSVSGRADADTRSDLTPEIHRREAQIGADPARRVAAGEAQIANGDPV